VRREQFGYLLFVFVGFAQLAVLVLIGDTRINAAGVFILVILVAWLGRRSRAAWWLFVAMNGWFLLGDLALLFSSGGSLIWGDVIATVLGSSLLLAILLSRTMRTWIDPPTEPRRR
jgi:hypothetical protein